MSWRQAFTNLAGLSVPGVRTSYDLDALPEALPTANLPALIPAFPESTGGLGQVEEGLTALTYDGAAWRAGLTVEHVLLWSPAGASGGLRTALPDIVSAVDAYLAALSADGQLGGALYEPLTVTRVQVGVQKVGGVSYLGARFRHEWVIALE